MYTKQSTPLLTLSIAAVGGLRGALLADPGVVLPESHDWGSNSPNDFLILGGPSGPNTTPQNEPKLAVFPEFR